MFGLWNLFRSGQLHCVIGPCFYWEADLTRIQLGGGLLLQA